MNANIYTPGELRILQSANTIMERKMRQYDVALTRPEDTMHYLQNKIGSNDSEMFYGLFLNNRHRVVEFAQISSGTIDGAAVYPREVVKQALAANAAAVIFAHNHPSGNPEPSQADVTITKRLKEALALLDIRVLDHIVVGHARCISLAERGLI
jgi:DNA repair protein RadC